MCGIHRWFLHSVDISKLNIFIPMLHISTFFLAIFIDCFMFIGIFIYSLLMFCWTLFIIVFINKCTITPIDTLRKCQLSITSIRCGHCVPIIFTIRKTIIRINNVWKACWLQISRSILHVGQGLSERLHF